MDNKELSISILTNWMCGLFAGLVVYFATKPQNSTLNGAQMEKLVLLSFIAFCIIILGIFGLNYFYKNCMKPPKNIRSRKNG